MPALPSGLIARMVAELALTGTERVLEVGTGLGFQTAILARLAGEVISIERFVYPVGPGGREQVTVFGCDER